MPACACTCRRSSDRRPGNGSEPRGSGFSLIAEDGNPLPGIPKRAERYLHGRGQDLRRDDQWPGAPAYAVPPAVFDRELSLSGNAIDRDAGMLAYISINGAGIPVRRTRAAVASADTYNALVAGQTLTVSDPSKGVIANDINVYGVSSACSAD